MMNGFLTCDLLGHGSFNNQKYLQNRKCGEFMGKYGFHYNYDIPEANWIIKHGAKVVGCGIHEITGNTFIVFQATDLYKKLCVEYKEKHSA